MPLINEIYANPEKYLESIPLIDLSEDDSPAIYDPSHDMWHTEIGRSHMASMRQQRAE